MKDKRLGIVTLCLMCVISGGCRVTRDYAVRSYHHEGVPTHISEEDIEVFERETGVSLPPELRRFYLRHNGGYVEPDRLVNWGNFYGVYPIVVPYEIRTKVIGGLSNLKDRMMTREDRIPSNALPIGTISGRDEIVMIISGEDVGAVYLWDSVAEPNWEHEGVDPDFRNMVRLSDSLEGFFLMLQED